MKLNTIGWLLISGFAGVWAWQTYKNHVNNGGAPIDAQAKLAFSNAVRSAGVCAVLVMLVGRK